MSQIYCISGFGADERIFSQVDFGNNEVHFVPWLLPEKMESLADYSKRMQERIDHANPILFGVSFGGMMAIEIAKIMDTEKVILVSSVKHRKEIPRWMRTAGKLHLDKIFPLRSIQLTEPIQNYNLGIEGDAELQLVREYRKNVLQQYTDWAVDKILNWQNTWQPANLVHIHGSRDHMFPIRNIHANHIIKGGGHFMVMNRARELNDILKNVLG